MEHLTAEERLKKFWKLFKEHEGKFDKNDLRIIADECKESKSLAPLYAIIYLSNKPLSESDLRRGQELFRAFPTKRDLEGIKRGAADCISGKVSKWNDIKSELGLKPEHIDLKGRVE